MAPFDRTRRERWAGNAARRLAMGVASVKGGFVPGWFIGR